MTENRAQVLPAKQSHSVMGKRYTTRGFAERTIMIKKELEGDFPLLLRCAISWYDAGGKSTS
ncbi:MAG: hypothetical protein M3298_09855 [Thermoproteota archaeon]|nr:hypothetical protein [Thermoproteota archaeon]